MTVATALVPQFPSTQELVAYPQNRRWRDIGTTDLFDENFGVITQIVGRDSLDVFSQGTGVAANINQTELRKRPVFVP